MSLTLRTTACESTGCSAFKVYDTTGLYSAENLTGWQAEAGDASGNPKISEVTAATVSFEIPGYDDTVTIDVYPTLPNTDDLPVTITVEDIAVSTSDNISLTTLPDGQYIITYAVAGTYTAGGDFTFSTQFAAYFICGVACCVNRLAVEYVDAGACNCKGKKGEKFQNAWFELKALELAACCGNITAANLALVNLQALCEGNCGCT